jgi:hypothetical protein
MILALARPQLWWTCSEILWGLLQPDKREFDRRVGPDHGDLQHLGAHGGNLLCNDHDCRFGGKQLTSDDPSESYGEYAGV